MFSICFTSLNNVYLQKTNLIKTQKFYVLLNSNPSSRMVIFLSQICDIFFQIYVTETNHKILWHIFAHTTFTTYVSYILVAEKSDETMILSQKTVTNILHIFVITDRATGGCYIFCQKNSVSDG